MHTIKLLFFLSESRIQKLPDLVKVALLLIFPVLSVVAVDLFWYYYLSDVLVAPEKYSGYILAVLPGLLIVYGLVAGRALNRVWDDHDTTEDLCTLIDAGEEKYVPRLAYILKRRIRLTTHLLLVITSLPFLFLLLILPYDEAMWLGVILISFFTFAITMSWVLAMELENPVSGCWVIRISDRVKSALKKFNESI